MHMVHKAENIHHLALYIKELTCALDLQIQMAHGLLSKLLQAQLYSTFYYCISWIAIFPA